MAKIFGRHTHSLKDEEYNLRELMNLYLLDVLALLSLLLSAFITRVMIWVNIADIPVARSSHLAPTPRAGGVAIVLGFLSFIIAVDLFFFSLLTPHLILVMGASLGIAALGLVDDVKSVSYKIRLPVQLCVATAVVLSGAKIEALVIPGLSSLPLGPYAPYLAVLWIVGFMNAFNFMDGLNGLVGGCTIVAGAFMLWFLPMTQPLFYLFLGLVIAILGFLKFNFHYGRIFLGDTGSQFVGFLIAVFALETAKYPAASVNFFIIPLLFLPFLYDAAFTIMRRSLKRAHVFTAHREHLYQLLNRSGWSHDQVSLLYCGYTLLSGLGAIYLHNHPHDVPLGFCIPYVILYVLHTYFVLRYAQLKGVKL